MGIKIAIVGDSRVGFFQHFCNTLNAHEDVTYQVTTLKERNVLQLRDAALPLLRNNHADKVFLLGGICNLTSPCYSECIRYFWPTSDISDLMNSLYYDLVAIRDDIVQQNFGGLVTLLPELGGDLVTYNKIDHPCLWMMRLQSYLDQMLPPLQLATKQLNISMGATTPWIPDTIYRRTKQGIWYPNYSLLYDGLHPEPFTAEKMVKQIMKTVNDYYFPLPHGPQPI